MRRMIHDVRCLGAFAALGLVLTWAAPAHAEAREFVLSVDRGGTWAEVGRLSYDRFYATRTLDLDAAGLRGGATSPWVRLRLTKRGGGLAHIDAIALNGQPPLLASGLNLLKLAATDNDVVDAHGFPELVFEAPRGRATLTLTARIEPKVIGKVPFQFPTQNAYTTVTADSAFYVYRLGSRPGQLHVDGKISGEALGAPLFADRLHCDSGHPQGTTYGWVRDDGKTLFVAVDFTPDNTRDGEKDYATVFVRVGNRVKAFKVTEAQRRWGVAGFEYTRRAPYQHKVYELAIPLAEIAALPGERIGLAFATYGTAALRDMRTEPLAFDPTSGVYAYRYFGDDSRIKVQLFDDAGNDLGNEFDVQSVSGMAFSYGGIAADPDESKFLVVWAEDDDKIWGRLVDPAGSVSGAEFMISDNATGTAEMPRVEYDPDQGRYLVVWLDNRTGASRIWGRFVDGDGTLLGASVDFDAADVGSGGPTPPIDLAYNGDDHEFLVIFTQGGDCVAWRVNASTGATAGTAIDVRSSCYYPNVAYDPSAGIYLAAWVDYQVGSRFIQRDGSLEPPVTHTANQFWSMDVSVVGATGRFMLVARDGNDYPTAFMVSAQSGQLFGAPIDLPTWGPGDVECYNHAGVRGNEAGTNFGVGCWDGANGGIFFLVLPTPLVSPAGVTTTEAGGTDTITVVLGEVPSSDVVFNVASTDTAEATVSATQLVFTSTTWDTAQMVTVTGVDDSVTDGNASYQVVFTVDASHSAEEYGGVIRTVNGTNLDDEAALIVTPTQVNTNESGSTQTVNVTLSIPPTSNVVVNVASTVATEAEALPATLTFTPASWNQAQVITVTGVDDIECDGAQSYTVTVTVDDSQSDALYDGLSVTVTGSNADDENPVCGNGTRECDEQCDDGNRDNGDGCSSACRLETAECGNGVQESGEECDDGNLTNGDGCSAACLREDEDPDGCGCATRGTTSHLPLLLLALSLLAWLSHRRQRPRP